MSAPSSKLVHALIGKSVIETLLVGALAVYSFMTVIPPYFHGWAEVTPAGIAGWAVNNASPFDRVQLQLFIDGRLVANAAADLSRPDVVASGWAKDEWHGFHFVLKDQVAGPHEARVYALHDSGHGRRKSLQLLGDPINFIVDDTGRLTALKK